jgi:radical SAM enzyme (rSAM/lipoprotein system)
MFSNIKQTAFRWFRKLETDVHELNYLFWECTTRCTLRCLHCGSDCSQNSSMPDMPLTDFLKALDTIPHPSKHFTIVLTGGEPLLRNDLVECGRAFMQRKMGWGMVTNGFFYNPTMHYSLINAGLGTLTISVDGMESTHNWLRGHPNSFSKTIDAIRLAANCRHLNFDVVTCVHRRNLKELPQLYKLLKANNVRAWRLFTITPIGRAINYEELTLASNEFTELMEFICSKRSEKLMDIKFSCEGYVGRYEMRVRSTPFFCRAGINIGSVLADGSIAACPNIDRRLSQGNIYKDNFYQVWNTRYDCFRNRQWTKTNVCADCDSFKNCLGNGLHNRHDGKLLVCHNSMIC